MPKIKIWLCVTVVFAILLILPVQAASSSTPAAVWITPTSKLYGLKLFYEGTVEKFTKILPIKYQEEYLLHLADVRSKEMLTMANAGIIDPRPLLTALNQSFAYQKAANNLAPNGPADMFWSTMEKLTSIFQEEKKGLNDWQKVRAESIKKYQEEQKNQNPATGQLLADIKKFVNEMFVAADRAEIERIQKLVAERADTDKLLNYLSAWAEQNRQLAQNLNNYPNLDPDQVDQAQKVANDFVDKIKVIKDSGTSDKDQLKQVVDNFKNNLIKLDQAHMAQMQNTAGTITPAAQNNQPAVVHNQPVAAPVKPKPVLKIIPSASVNTQKLQLLYNKNIVATQNQTILEGYGAMGGLPPYHYQLETGVGFPPHGVILTPIGDLSGMPTIAGTYTFGVCVVDSSGSSVCGTTVMTVQETEVKPAPPPEPTQPQCDDYTWQRSMTSAANNICASTWDDCRHNADYGSAADKACYDGLDSCRCNYYKQNASQFGCTVNDISKIDCTEWID